MRSDLRIGIDIGGTFTDFVVFDAQNGSLETLKVLSTPNDPAQAVLDGFVQMGLIPNPAEAETTPSPRLDLIHGSTVATNALLERKGDPIAFVTTRGFGDLLQIGRQDRPELYDWFAVPPSPLAPAHLRFEVSERVDSTGRVITPLMETELETLVQEVAAGEAASVAVCLLFSFLHPEHERKIVQRLRQAGLHVSASHEILPEFREYERASTTAVNAYVSPALDRYLGRLEQSLDRQIGADQISLRVMQSNGGHIQIAEARQNGVRCILSGPAGGVIGAHYMGQVALDSPAPRLISFDMGGTSTDVSLIDGSPRVTTESVVGGCPIRIPVIDIHTIGAGGGSIASVDPGGALRVGPESAGADPGPACYGGGSRPNDAPIPTVTDANLVLGRLSAAHFLGGKIVLSESRAFEALTSLGSSLGLDAYEAALGVIEVVNAHMERALRVISVERGFDPADFMLFSFGGAGGLHAADLARRIGIPGLIISPLASTLSAFGMLAAKTVKDYTQTVMLPAAGSLAHLPQYFEPLVIRGIDDLIAEGTETSQIQIERALDMRYTGQSYELTIPWNAIHGDPQADFHSAHHLTYGFHRANSPIEIVNIRVRAVGPVKPPTLPAGPLSSADASLAALGMQPVVFRGDQQETIQKPVPFYQYERLQPGNHLAGPAVVIRSDTTVWLGPQDQATVDPYANLVIEVGHPDSPSSAWLNP